MRKNRDFNMNKWLQWLVSFFIACTISSAALAQNKSLPPEIKYSGKLQNTQLFTDKLGSHILISSKLQESKRDTEGNANAFIFVYDYLKAPDQSVYVMNWKLEDGEKDCPVDVGAEFIAPISVTDLDKNGINEVTVAYVHYCKGDVSPDGFKVIMREDQQKYGLRGSTFTPLEKNDGKKPPCCTEKFKDPYAVEADGMYVNERDFKNAPKVFLEHAKKTWLKYRGLNKGSFNGTHQ